MDFFCIFSAEVTYAGSVNNNLHKNVSWHRFLYFIYLLFLNYLGVAQNRRPDTLTIHEIWILFKWSSLNICSGGSRILCKGDGWPSEPGYGGPRILCKGDGWPSEPGYDFIKNPPPRHFMKNSVGTGQGRFWFYRTILNIALQFSFTTLYCTSRKSQYKDVYRRTIEIP